MRIGAGLLGAATGFLVTIASQAGLAAGKYCGDPLESGLSSGATQEEAHAAAQQWWSSRAGALGRGYQDWDNADKRAMECRQDGRGVFHCRASGRPCLPPGTLPDNLPKIDM
ncbi:hypothetical protein [Hyphomicrobium sp.]|uniref:hypothetical protein n=1 Tax=Hyphomicrobium sp. TaxID=82 RepID=UPI002FDD1809